MRYFNTGDTPTDHNLRRLDHLASPRHCNGTADHMHDWLCAAIQSIGMLPPEAGRHFDAWRFKIGDAHYSYSDALRAKRWQDLVVELSAMIDAAESDPRLDRKGPAGPLDATGRPETAGERIRTQCEALRGEPFESAAFSAILSRIEGDAHFAINSDVAELRDLFQDVG